jgi:hypothetical protein
MSIEGFFFFQIRGKKIRASRIMNFRDQKNTGENQEEQAPGHAKMSPSILPWFMQRREIL